MIFVSLCRRSTSRHAIVNHIDCRDSTVRLDALRWQRRSAPSLCSRSAAPLLSPLR